MIADIVGGSRDRIVVKAMIRLARELGLKVVVEGVESVAQLDLLAEWGCDLYQGFLGAGALDEAELARFVTASDRAPTPPRPAQAPCFASPAATTRISPREICSAPLQPRLAGRPVAADDQLAVGPQLGRALQPLDIGEQAGEVGEARSARR